MAKKLLDNTLFGGTCINRSACIKGTPRHSPWVTAQYRFDCASKFSDRFPSLSDLRVLGSLMPPSEETIPRLVQILFSKITKRKGSAEI